MGRQATDEKLRQGRPGGGWEEGRGEAGCLGCLFSRISPGAGSPGPLGAGGWEEEMVRWSLGGFIPRPAVEKQVALAWPRRCPGGLQALDVVVCVWGESLHPLNLRPGAGPGGGAGR